MPAATAQEAPQPNIVLILTDDQRADDVWMMSAMRRRLAGPGLTFERAFVSDPLCCPSRVSLLSGQYAHSTGVWSNRGEDGGWVAFDREGLASETINVPLHAAGYRTGYIGKFLNNYQMSGGDVPRGWDRWFVFNHQSGAYYDYEMISSNGGPSEVLPFGSEPTDYSTDVIAAEASSFIEDTAPGKPLFLVVAPYAPHGPPKPAPRHLGAFDGFTFARSASYEEANVRDKPRYIRRLPIPLARPYSMDRLRRRAETLLAADEMINGVMRSLRVTGRLENTMIVFTSDNGFLLGEHRWGYKTVPYDESIRVPLVIRYDPLTSGTTTGALAANVDLAPTFAELAGVPFGADGVSLLPLLTDGSQARKFVPLEAEEFTPGRLTTVPSYCGVRAKAKMFVRYATGEEELYDLRRDPYQLVSQDDEPSRPLRRLRGIAKAQCDPVPPGFSWTP